MNANVDRPSRARAEPEGGGTVFVVDDSPASLELIGEVFRGSGHTLRLFETGAALFEALEAQIPDLFLLDMNMPAPDGCAICRRIKSDARVADVPVLFISALSGEGDILQAFEAGGVDYVTKPFRLEEIRARVRAHLHTGVLERALRDERERLDVVSEQLEQIERERLDWIQMVAHDLRSPLASARGRIELAVRSAGVPLGASPDRNLALAIRSLTLMTQFVDDLLDCGRIQVGRLPLRLEPTEMLAMIRDTLAALSGLPGAERVRVRGSEARVACDGGLLARVMTNLVSNALQYDRSEASISVEVRPRGRGCVVTVSDRGPGLPQGIREFLAEPGSNFAVSPSRRVGLGLAFAKSVVEAHGGVIAADLRRGGGSSFRVELPGAAGAAAAKPATRVGEPILRAGGAEAEGC